MGSGWYEHFNLLISSPLFLPSAPERKIAVWNQGPKAYAWDHKINILAHVEIEDVTQTRISNKHDGVCINTPEVFDG